MDSGDIYGVVWGESPVGIVAEGSIPAVHTGAAVNSVSTRLVTRDGTDRMSNVGGAGGLVREVAAIVGSQLGAELTIAILRLSPAEGNQRWSFAPVAHTDNPSGSGRRILTNVRRSRIIIIPVPPRTPALSPPSDSTAAARR